MNRIKRYLVGRDLLIIVTHQSDIRKLLGRRGESILIFVPEELRTSPRRVQVKNTCTLRRSLKVEVVHSLKFFQLKLYCSGVSMVNL